MLSQGSMLCHHCHHLDLSVFWVPALCPCEKLKPFLWPICCMVSHYLWNLLLWNIATVHTVQASSSSTIYKRHWSLALNCLWWHLRCDLTLKSGQPKSSAPIELVATTIARSPTLAMPGSDRWARAVVPVCIPNGGYSCIAGQRARSQSEPFLAQFGCDARVDLSSLPRVHG